MWHNGRAKERQLARAIRVVVTLPRLVSTWAQQGSPWRQFNVEAQSSMTHQHINRVPSEVDAIRATAVSDHDAPVLMLNLNRYTIAAAYPNGEEYQTYLAKIEEAVSRVGGNLLWRTPVSGQPVGCEHDRVDEILAVWYPSHTAFLRLRNQNEELFRLRELCVANSVIHRCPGDRFPLQP